VKDEQHFCIHSFSIRVVTCGSPVVYVCTTKGLQVHGGLCCDCLIHGFSFSCQGRARVRAERTLSAGTSAEGRLPVPPGSSARAVWHDPIGIPYINPCLNNKKMPETGLILWLFCQTGHDFLISRVRKNGISIGCHQIITGEAHRYSSFSPGTFRKNPFMVVPDDLIS
jgi:hypothetical protein